MESGIKARALGHVFLKGLADAQKLIMVDGKFRDLVNCVWFKLHFGGTFCGSWEALGWSRPLRR